MYCSSCGTPVTTGLSYCNRCGAKLSGGKDDEATKQSELFPESLVWAIVTVFIVGVGSLFGLIAMMKKMDFSEHWILAFNLLILLLTVAVESVLIWLLLQRKSAVREGSGAERLKETRELERAEARALPAHAPSVTEQTTRTFEPVYSERKAE